MTPISLVSFSDCHLGASRCDSIMMTQSLRQLIIPLLDEVEFASIGGDLVDAGIGLSERPALDILAFVVEFLKVCAEKNIVVRVLRGTYSHDRTQLEIIPVLHERYGFKNDLRYFDKISLEYIERFDMRVLYIPDDVPYGSSDEVLVVVKELMADVGWDYVDLAFMHSYFDFVLPEFASKKPKIVYTEKQFDFVKRQIFVGHVHNGGISGKVAYNKSTDRTCHGEEDPKGCLRYDWDGKKAKLRFIENLNANIFRTFNYSHLDKEVDIVIKLEEDISKLPKHLPLYVRVEHPKAEIRNALQKYMKREHPQIDFVHKEPKTKDSGTEDVITTVSDIKLLAPPTEETLPDAILEEISRSGTSITITRDRIHELLKKARAA